MLETCSYFLKTQYKVKYFPFKPFAASLKLVRSTIDQAFSQPIINSSRRKQFKSWAQKKTAQFSVLIYRAAAVSSLHPRSLHFSLSPAPLSANTTSHFSLKFLHCRLHRLLGHLSFLPLYRKWGWGRLSGSEPPATCSHTKCSAYWTCIQCLLTLS